MEAGSGAEGGERPVVTESTLTFKTTSLRKIKAFCSLVTCVHLGYLFFFHPVIGRQRVFTMRWEELCTQS